MTLANLAMPSPDAVASEHSRRVATHIAGAIERTGGWLPFDRYMQLVLYAPQLGYYAAGARKFGDSAAGGDFVTAPEISPLFAQALAQQVTQLFEQVPARIVEFGAGSGALANDLLAALAKRRIALESYSIVEVSSDLIARQRERLRGAPVEWLSTPPKGFNGVMVANEVLDVMPVKLFVKRGTETFERGVTSRSSGFAFEERRARDDLAAAVAAIESEHGVLPDGYSSEVNLIAEGWMRSSA
ncbi:MAG: SAM-dependent methyltransferase, partial [Burkholderiaceae bacterium]